MTIAWMVKDGIAHNFETGEKEVFSFLNLCFNDFPNHGVSHADISNQRWNQCRFDHWTQLFEWCWSIHFWWIGAMLVNSHIIFVHLHSCAKKEKNQMLSHMKFCRTVSCTWMNPDTDWRRCAITQRMTKKRRKN